MSESINGVIRLPEDDANAFVVVTYWIYSKKLVGWKPSQRPEERVFLEAHQAKIYVLADKLMMEDMQNAVIDACFPFMGLKSTKLEFHEVVFEQVPLGSPFRRLALALLASQIYRCGGVSEWKKKSTTIYPDFASVSAQKMEYVLDAIAHFPDRKDLPKLKDCEWHKHYLTFKCG
jgi:hypothetical protein